VLITDFDP